MSTADLEFMCTFFNILIELTKKNYFNIKGGNLDIFPKEIIRIL